MPDPTWWPDPTGRHQYRYWDGTTWTDHVADHGVTATDPVDAAVFAAPVVVPLAPPVAPSYTPGRAHDPTNVLAPRYGALAVDVFAFLLIAIAITLAFAKPYTEAEIRRDLSCAIRENTRGDTTVTCDGVRLWHVFGNYYEPQTADSGMLVLVVAWAWFALADRLLGASPGKLLFGLRVVGEDGRRVGIGRSTVRAFLLLVDGPITFFLCGILLSSTSLGHQRFGDRLAQSFVVTKADAGRPVELPD